MGQLLSQIMERTRWRSEEHRFSRRLAINQQGLGAVEDWHEAIALLRIWLQGTEPLITMPGLDWTTQSELKLQANQWPRFMVAYLYDPCKGTNACYKLYAFLVRNGMTEANARTAITWWWTYRPEMCNATIAVASPVLELSYEPIKRQYALYRTRVWDMALGQCTCFAGRRQDWYEFVDQLEMGEDINSINVREALVGNTPWKTPKAYEIPVVANPGMPPFYLPFIPEEMMEINPMQEEAPIMEDAPEQEEWASSVPFGPEEQQEWISSVPFGPHVNVEATRAKVAKVDALTRSKKAVKRVIDNTEDKLNEAKYGRLDTKAKRELIKTRDNHKKRLVELEEQEENLLHELEGTRGEVLDVIYKGRDPLGEHQRMMPGLRWEEDF